MLHLLRHAVAVNRGERKAVAILFLHYFLVSAAVIAGKSARDALFLSHFGKSALPAMYVANAIIITAAMAVVSLVSKRLTTRAITTGCLAVFAASLALLSAALNGYTIAAFYVWMELIGAIVIMQAWTLVGNAFDPRQAKRLFGVIATGGSIAATAGGAGVAFLASRFAPPVLIAVVAAVLGIACVTAWSASRFEAPRRKAPVSLPSGRAKLGRYTIAIATIVAASAVVSAIVQYRFQVGAAAAFPNRGELIVFFGRFYSWTGVASLITQLFLSRLLLSRFGVIAALAVLPVCFTGGSVFTLLSPSLWSVGFCRFSDLTFKYTLNNTSVEMLWLPVPPEERRAVKPFVAGTLKSLSEASAGLLMVLLAGLAPIWTLSAAVLAACSIWIGTVNRLKTLYRSTLASVISKNQLDAGSLRIDAHDPGVIASIEQVLLTGDEAEQMSALSFLDGFSLTPWAKTLRRLYTEGSPEVRDAVLRVAADDRNVIPDDWIVASVRQGIPAAIQVAAYRRIGEVKPLLVEMMNSGAVETSVAAASALLRDGDHVAARARIELLLDSDDPRTVARALDALPADGGLVDPARLRRCLTAADAGVVRAALRVAEVTHDERAIGEIIHSLSRPRCAIQARMTLRKLPETQVVEALTAAVTSDATDDQLRCAILRVMADYPAGIAENRVASTVSTRFLALYQEYAALLESIRRARALESSVSQRVAHDFKEVVEVGHATEALRLRFSTDPDAILLRDYAEQQRSAVIAIAIRLAALETDNLPSEECLQVARSGDRARLPYVLELLDTTLPREQARLLIPLIDFAHQPDSDRSHGDPDPCAAADELAHYAPKTDVWATSIIRHYVNRKKGANAFVGDGMHSTLEKTIYLKTSEIFSGVAAESLSRLAAIADERSWPAGSVIFKEGEAGDALYIVLSGSVLIAKGNVEIASLRKGACFGEMAVLDGAPRSADAIVRDEAVLLRIGSEEFYEALAENPPLMRNVIALLTKRLRNTSAKVALATTS